MTQINYSCQLISNNFNMLVSLDNIQCWALQWKAKSQVWIQKNAWQGRRQQWKQAFDLMKQYLCLPPGLCMPFLSAFWTIVWRCNRRGSYRSSKSWNVVWHSTHIISQSSLIFCLAAFNLSRKHMIKMKNLSPKQWGTTWSSLAYRGLLCRHCTES